MMNDLYIFKVWKLHFVQKKHSTFGPKMEDNIIIYLLFLSFFFFYSFPKHLCYVATFSK